MSYSAKKLAFVFPGQGSQTVGMLAELAKTFPIIQQTYTQASEILGYDLWQLVQAGPETMLNQTEHTQPALLVASVALWQIWQIQKGPEPLFLAGHSLGEYSALVCAGALDFNTAVKLVAERGQLMQAAVPAGQGAMAAIVGLSEAQVQTLCQQAAKEGIVEPANFNAVGQIVVAGHTPAVEYAITLAKQSGAKLAKLLPVSVPSHCALMKPAAEQLAMRLNKVTLQPPRIPVIHNVDVCSYSNAAQIKEALIKQLDHPVRWVETIQYLAKEGVELVIECGPGKVLAGLNKRIVENMTTFSINTTEQLQEALNVMPAKAGIQS